jgi:3-carboxy-cis,cis-muconate cycloisomerase
VQTAGAATAAMASVLEGLTVDPARMRANLEAARGVVFAERAVVLLTPTLGRDKAHALVTAALEDSRASGRRFGEALGAVPAAAAALGADGLRDLERPEAYLGEADTLRAQLLQADPPRTE